MPHSAFICIEVFQFARYVNVEFRKFFVFELILFPSEFLQLDLLLIEGVPLEVFEKFIYGGLCHLLRFTFSCAISSNIYRGAIKDELTCVFILKY